MVQETTGFHLDFSHENLQHLGCLFCCCCCWYRLRKTLPHITINHVILQKKQSRTFLSAILSKNDNHNIIEGNLFILKLST